MFIVAHRKIFYTISAILMIASIFVLFAWGLNLGIDFKGGTLLEVVYSGSRPAQENILSALSPLKFGEFSVRPTGEDGYIVRMKTVTETKHQAALNALKKTNPNVVEKRFDSIGPILGAEAARKSLFSIFAVIIAIVLFITFAFRHVSEPVSSWKYGLITIFALLHDMLVPAGVFAVLGHTIGIEIDTLFVTAILVILGFSVHDTIVVFDRVRENLRLNHEHRERKPFEQIVGESINQTFVRSINTSLTTLLALAVLYVVGSDATRHFSLALLVGITAGTYSSIFLGSPLLVTVEKWQHKRQ